jgi:hypothetical protein
MLSVTTLVNQLTTMQQLAVERDLQSKVAYNSSTLSVYSGMLFGETKKEILANCSLDNKNYPKRERPIYQAILDFYGLKAETTKDQLLSDVYFAIHEETYETNSSKVKKLDELFHQLKRANLEQESAELLLELTNCSKASPLYTVYKHLYDKYNATELNNNLAYQAFEKLNIQLSNFLDGNLKNHSVRDLITTYKELRSIHLENVNRVSESILNVSMLLLANYCGQTQLLNENKWDLSNLLEICKTQIEDLPFGVERMFIQNTFDNTLKNAIQKEKLEISTLSLRRLELTTNQPSNYNFGLEIAKRSTTKQITQRENLISGFVRRITTTISIKQNSIIQSPHRI